MAALKTKVTNQSVAAYLNQIPDETKRTTCLAICKLMEEVTRSSAKMWGESIIGVGDYRYQYESGRSNDWFMMGFSPRKQNISLYILGCDITGEHAEVLSRLGKHKTGKGCIYINGLKDIDIAVLRELCKSSYNSLKTK